VRPCWNCRRFTPNVPPHTFDEYGDTGYNPHIIGGCAGNGIQVDNGTAEEMECDLFRAKEAETKGDM